jgi:hypothetical protein
MGLLHRKEKKGATSPIASKALFALPKDRNRNAEGARELVAPQSLTWRALGMTKRPHNRHSLRGNDP